MPVPTRTEDGSAGCSARRIYMDCTDTCATGKNTGIQRVVRNFVRHASALGPALGWPCVPFVIRNGAMVRVIDMDDASLRHPRMTLRTLLNQAYLRLTRYLIDAVPFAPLQRFLAADRRAFGLAWLLFLPFQALGWVRAAFTRPVACADTNTCKPLPGDMLLLADASWSPAVMSLMQRMKRQGVTVVVFLHDIIPLTHPHVCHPVHVERFGAWLECVTHCADLVVCNSRFTQRSYAHYLETRPGGTAPALATVHLGHDMGARTTGVIQHRQLRAALGSAPHGFVCVGTLEPRKNLAVLLDAFDALWASGEQAPLILIGRAGWLCEEIVRRIRRHPLRNRRLYWFNNVDDADLLLAYRQASALIFPSLVEGFGLPLVEAFSLGLRVIASDIPVFREIAEGHARFFPPADAQALTLALQAHLAQPASAKAAAFRWQSWEMSTHQLLKVMQEFSRGR